VKSAGFELPNKSSVAIWAEGMASTKAVPSESLAYDDPQVGIVHWAKSLAQRGAAKWVDRLR